MIKIRICYFSRNNSRLGYSILEKLVQLSEINILSVFLDQKSVYDNPYLSKILQKKYDLEIGYYRGDKCKFFNSISQLAKTHGIPVIFLPDINEDSLISSFRLLNPDLFLFGGGWPQLVDEKILNCAKIGGINVHPSLLPHYRGTDVHRWQIFFGEPLSGVTFHKMDDSFDTGDIINQQSIVINEYDTPQIFHDKAAQVAAEMVESVLSICASSFYEPSFMDSVVQKYIPSNYCHKWDWIDDSIMKISWNSSVYAINNLIRASNQESYKYRGPYFSYSGAKYFIRKAKIVTISSYDGNDPGVIISRENDGIIIGTKTSSKGLLIEKIQKYNLFYKINPCIIGREMKQFFPNKKGNEKLL